MNKTIYKESESVAFRSSSQLDLRSLGFDRQIMVVIPDQISFEKIYTLPGQYEFLNRDNREIAKAWVDGRIRNVVTKPSILCEYSEFRSMNPLHIYWNDPFRLDPQTYKCVSLFRRRADVLLDDVQYKNRYDFLGTVEFSLPSTHYDREIESLFESHAIRPIFRYEN